MTDMFTNLKLFAVAALCLGTGAAFAQQNPIKSNWSQPGQGRIEVFGNTSAAPINERPKSAQAVLLSEDFNNGIPANWTTHNLDGRPPAAALGSTNPFSSNRGWVGRLDDAPSGPGDSCASSVSWFELAAGAQAVQADRWLISPAIVIPATAQGVRFSWRAKSNNANFRDGYQVLVSSASNQPGSDFNVQFRVPNNAPFADGTQPPATRPNGENNFWTDRTFTLRSNVGGQTFYLAFQQNSRDMLWLDIDDVLVEVVEPYEAAVADVNNTPNRETMIPQSLADSVKLYAAVENRGTSPLGAVTVTFNKTAGPGGSFSTSGSVGSLVINQRDTVYSPALRLTTPGTYSFQATVSTSVGQPNSSTNTTRGFSFMVTDSVLARDRGVFNSSIGINDGRGEIAQYFFIPKADTVTSITVFAGALGSTGGPSVGDTLMAAVYAIDTTLKLPTGAPLGMSPMRFVTGAASRAYNFPIRNTSNGYLVLQPGLYAFAVLQQSRRNANINGSTDNYIPNMVATRITTTATTLWSPQEFSNLYLTYGIRPNFGTQGVIASARPQLQQIPLTLSPNPARGQVSLQLTLKREAATNVQVTDLAGRTVAIHNLGKLPAGVQRTSVPLRGLAAGTYLVSIAAEGQGISTSRLVVE